MKRCIICGKEFLEESIEHIIPEAIGGQAKIKCVCRLCNNKLGDKVDAPLIDDQFILMLREKYRIKNRDGKEVNIIKHFKFRNQYEEKVIVKTNIENGIPLMYDGSQNPQLC